MVFNFDNINKELYYIEKKNLVWEKKEYYRKKINEIDNEYNIEHKKTLKWMEKVKIEIQKYKYEKKERAWIHFQMNMFYQSRSEYKKIKNDIDEYLEKELIEEIRLKNLYEKLDKMWKRIKRFKNMIDEYIEEKNMYKEVSELSKIMINNFDINEKNKKNL